MIESGDLVAIKIVKEEFMRLNSNSIRSVQKERDILRIMDHHNIVKMLDYSESGMKVEPSGICIQDLVYFVMEYVPCGDLFSHCMKMGAMGEDAGRKFFSQILDAFEYMHSRSVAHRDVKPENILVDEKNNLKLADFGFASCGNIDALQGCLGSPAYMAPEIWEGKTYKGTQVDLFALGVVLFAIVTGKFAFGVARENDLLYSKLKDGRNNVYWNYWEVKDFSPSPAFKDLIQKLLSYDGDDRPTIEQIRAHPWM